MNRALILATLLLVSLPAGHLWAGNGPNRINPRSIRPQQRNSKGKLSRGRSVRGRTSMAARFQRWKQRNRTRKPGQRRRVTRVVVRRSSRRLRSTRGIYRRTLTLVHPWRSNGKTRIKYRAFRRSGRRVISTGRVRLPAKRFRLFRGRRSGGKDLRQLWKRSGSTVTKVKVRRFHGNMPLAKLSRAL